MFSSASSVLYCHSSAMVSSSFAAPAAAVCGSPNVSLSPMPNCQLVTNKVGADRLHLVNPSALLLLPEGLGATNRRRSFARRGGLTVQRRRATRLKAALQQNESTVADEAWPGSKGVEGEKDSLRGFGVCPCRVCGRRGLVASLGGLLASTGLPRTASASIFDSADYNAIREAVHPPRPTWYEEFYAQSMAKLMASYEAEVAGYKRQLFGKLDEKVEHILEVGIGTGPNLKYYGNLPHLQRVVGVDPNLQMAKYCADSATAAGLSDTQFEFLNAVGEGIPVLDESMDAVVSTLTLCSVSDVSHTLQEVKRVLRPGGAFLFVEHVAAPEGTGLRFWQGLLDPLQQLFADGCHLTRNTLQSIDGAQFGSVQSATFSVPSVSLFSPHVMGVAYK